MSADSLTRQCPVLLLDDDVNGTAQPAPNAFLYHWNSEVKKARSSAAHD
jgi:hypothetical protein